jgi:hypothetical protein
MRRRSLVLFCAALALGCTVERAAAPEDTAEVFLNQERFNPSEHAARGRAPAATNREGEEVAGIPAIGFSMITSNMIIRTATASIKVDSLEPAVERVNELATRVGGYVAGSGIETGRNQLRQAFIELKVPAQRFTEVVAGLKPIGTLESVRVSAEDVGEEFVDVRARMENSRRLERRLLDLLAARTGKLKDVLDVEQSLARVREEIERYEGRLRYLQAHTAMSTLSVTVHEPLPVIGTAGKSVMGEAFTQAWRNFVVLLSLAVQSLGVILPLGFVAGGAWLVTRRWRLGRQRTA